MRSFNEDAETIRERAKQVLAVLTIIFLIGFGVTARTVIVNGFLLNPSFLVGFLLFGALGFFALEIVHKLSFLGRGVIYGAVGLILLLLVGSAFGGKLFLAFASGTVSGITWFYLKSVYALYYIFMTEARETEETLRVSELEPLGQIFHYGIEGMGSNFELLNYLIEAMGEGKEVLYYARYTPKENRLDQFTREAFMFYANIISPLPKVKKRDPNLIKQIAIEASYLDTMERSLFNYWSRAYLNGDYTSVIVPYDEEFVEKAAICERSFGDDLEIAEILGDSGFLMILESLSYREGVIDVYTRWTMNELMERIEPISPVAQSEPDSSL